MRFVLLLQLAVVVEPRTPPAPRCARFSVRAAGQAFLAPALAITLAFSDGTAALAGGALEGVAGESQAALAGGGSLSRVIVGKLVPALASSALTAADQLQVPQQRQPSLAPLALSPQPSALSPQPSALSPQPSALSPQPSALLLSRDTGPNRAQFALLDGVDALKASPQLKAARLQAERELVLRTAAAEQVEYPPLQPSALTAALSPDCSPLFEPAPEPARPLSLRLPWQASEEALAKVRVGVSDPAAALSAAADALGELSDAAAALPESGEARSAAAAARSAARVTQAVARQAYEAEPAQAALASASASARGLSEAVQRSLAEGGGKVQREAPALAGFADAVQRSLAEGGERVQREAPVLAEQLTAAERQAEQAARAAQPPLVAAWQQAARVTQAVARQAVASAAPAARQAAASASLTLQEASGSGSLRNAAATLGKASEELLGKAVGEGGLGATLGTDLPEARLRLRAQLSARLDER
jgi:hypothetical protein